MAQPACQFCCDSCHSVPSAALQGYFFFSSSRHLHPAKTHPTSQSQHRPRPAHRWAMAHANPIVEALMDDLAGRLGDADAVQRVQRSVDVVRAEIGVHDALHAEAAAQLALARQRLAEAAFNAAAARRAALQEQEPPAEGLALLLPLDDPEVSAHAAAYVEAAARVELIKRHELVLVEALAFLAVARAIAFALNRVHLLPGVLVTAAAAYALAYVASWGAVVPGPTSILRIAVLVLCFLLGIPVVGSNLP